MDDDIEDLAIDMDEVNDCFERGIVAEGPGYLERVEKLILSDPALDRDEKQIIRAFDNINRKISKGREVHVLSEFEKFGFNSETLLRLGSIVVNSSPRNPILETRREISDRSAGEDTYDNDFEEYDSGEFEDADERIPDSSSSSLYPSSGMYPTYTEQEPARVTRSKTAPQSQCGAGSRTPSSAPTSLVSPAGLSARMSSRFKTTSWIQKGQWRLGEKIGSGSFGEVFQGMSDDGFLFAVKRLHIVNHKEIVNLTSEIELMQSLSHENIVKYLGAKVDEELGVVYIFQEWVPGGSVAHLLKRFGPFSPGVVRTYTRQILCGLEYLHANGVVHRDIKGGNILVDDSGNVKLADFGASTTLSSFGETQETATIKGTPYFMAPEVLSASKYGRRGDVWAVGCTMVQMLTGDPPWKDRKLQTLIQLHMLLSTWEGIPPIDREIPDDLRDFLDLCFQKDSRTRPMPTVLLQHPFLRDVKDEFADSMGSGGTLDIREQMERAVTRASFRPDDTFGEIDRQLAAKGGGAVAGPPDRYRSDSGSTSEGNSPSSNPFSKKSSASAALAALAAASPVSSPSSDNPYAKVGPRASTAAAALQHPHNPMTFPIAPAPSHTGNAPSAAVATARRGSGSSQGSDDSRDGHHCARGKGDHAHSFRSGSGIGRPVHSAAARHRSPRDGSADESDYTPRSSHGGVPKPMKSSSSTSALPPSRHSRSKVHSRNQSGPDMEVTTSTTAAPPGAHGGPKWKCLNNKCGKWNEAEDDYCVHCAFRRGATGDRGTLTKSAEFEVEDSADVAGQWRCRNSRCGKMNGNEDDFCMHCATRKGATGARGSGAVLFAAGR